MIYLLAAALGFGLLVWAGRRGRAPGRAGWRITAAGLAIGLFAAAAFVGIRGGWSKAVVLALLGLSLALSARWRRSPAAPPARSEAMSASEARSLLGVGPQATAADIRVAYARLMRLVHPDRAGGAHGLAAQVNRARDRLLKGR